MYKKNIALAMISIQVTTTSDFLYFINFGSKVSALKINAVPASAYKENSSRSLM
jgi:hypothetical protein